MKKQSMYISHIISVTLIMGGLVYLTSCHNANSNNTVTPTGTKADSTSGLTNDDVKFLNKAAEINLEEIRIGTLAQQNGGMKDIKEMGKMLTNDHTKSWNELTELAKKKSVNIPTTLDSNAVADYNSLSNLTGKEFDKKFCNMMIDGHKQAISVFEKEASDTKDSDIKNWANSTLPTLHKHLDDAITCEQTVNSEKK